MLKVKRRRKQKKKFIIYNCIHKTKFVQAHTVSVTPTHGDGHYFPHFANDAHRKM